jgi:hypothetical protein
MLVVLGACGVVTLTSGCTSVKLIGSLNMVSTRNVNADLKYQRITTYSGGGESTLKKSRAVTIEDAINDVVRKVPGGEFLMNVKIFAIDEGKYYAVQGDVWGSGDQTFKGFRVGDRVTFKNPSFFTGPKYLTGTILSLQSDEFCIVRPDSDPRATLEVSYDDMTKTNEPAPPPLAPGPMPPPTSTPAPKP